MPEGLSEFVFQFFLFSLCFDSCIHFSINLRYYPCNNCEESSTNGRGSLVQVVGRGCG